jgi:gentisate 1,2-dioxygenase
LGEALRAEGGVWERLKGLVPREPAHQAVPHRWRYAEVRPYVMEAARHITAEEAERRVLLLENPGLRGGSQITNTLFAGMQLIMPGEVAPRHRHTQSALRFIVEGHGAYTTVDDQRVDMEPGDFVVTPSWRWHHHGNESSGPMVWLDGLDIPMLRHFAGTFREDESEWTQPTTPFRGLIHFPYVRARERLSKMQEQSAPDAHLGHLMRYLDPVDGSWAMPTIAPMIRLLPRGFATRPYRSSDSMVFVGVEGQARLRVGEQEFDLAPHDVAVVPGWMTYTLEGVDEAVVFSYSDRAAQERLGFFREQRL